MKLFTPVLGCFMSFLVISPVLGETTIQIEPDTSSFQNKKIEDGAISVSVSYGKIENFNEDLDNFKYDIFYNQKLEIEELTSTLYTGSASLQDLDNNGMAEVIVQTYSGGAHCCTNLMIYSWLNNQFTKLELEGLNGGGGIFKDLDNNNKYEYLTDDNAFLYQFSSYAASYPPSLIYAFKDGKFEDVTRQYPQELRKRLDDMYEAILESNKQAGEVNGLLAGYVAQKILS